MRLIQFPFSHNCIKVRRALEAKGLDYETLDILPTDRREVITESGQALVPVLRDGERCIPDSTAILRYLEQVHPEPSLLPGDPAQHGACWLIEDWADRAFMEMTRRIGYWQRLQTPEVIAQRFFPGARGLKLRISMLVARRVLIRRFALSAEQNAADETQAVVMARLALERLAGKPVLFDRLTVADITLATMTVPLWAAASHVRNDPAVRDLLDWGRPIVGQEVLRMYGAA